MSARPVPGCPISEDFDPRREILRQWAQPMECTPAATGAYEKELPTAIAIEASECADRIIDGPQ
jgi:hypothetical protein